MCQKDRAETLAVDLADLLVAQGLFVCDRPAESSLQRDLLVFLNKLPYFISSALTTGLNVRRINNKKNIYLDILGKFHAFITKRTIHLNVCP